MNIFQAVFLGIVQGLTEFLPISSSGHLVLFQKILAINEPTLVFDTFVHIGTLFAVLTVFWQDILTLLKKPFQRLTWLLIAGTIPTAIIGFTFEDFFTGLYKTGSTLGVEFIITGCILIFAEKLGRGRKGVRETSYLDAAFIGVMQGAAILPAISRSGLTISGALLRNLDREFAAKFSFLLSIPPILGGALFQFKDMMETGSAGFNILPLAAGTIAAAAAGYLSIRFMLGILKRGNLRGFAYYVFALGGLVLIDQLFTHIFF